MELTENERRCLKRIVQIGGNFGADLYLVGGTIRDILLKKEATDFDLACSSHVRDISVAFSRVTGGSLITTGKRFSNYRVVNSPGIFDFSPFKGDDIEDDLLRRDMTINAMAYPLNYFVTNGFQKESVIDPSGGMADLQEGVIRAISEENLLLDPVRLFRIFRFASELSFSIEDETGRIPDLHRDLVEKLPGERVREEVFATMGGPSFPSIPFINSFYRLLFSFVGGNEDESGARERVKGVLEASKGDHYAPYMEDILAPVSYKSRYLDIIILISIFFTGHIIPRELPSRLFSSFSLSRREKMFSTRVREAWEEGFFPGESPCPIKGGAFLAMGPYTPHILLLSEGLGLFRGKRNMVKEALTYYAKCGNLVKKGIYPWSPREILPLFSHLDGELRKTLFRQLKCDTMGGKVASREDALNWVKERVPDGEKRNEKSPRC